MGWDARCFVCLIGTRSPERSHVLENRCLVVPSRVCPTPETGTTPEYRPRSGVAICPNRAPPSAPVQRKLAGATAEDLPLATCTALPQYASSTRHRWRARRQRGSGVLDNEPGARGTPDRKQSTAARNCRSKQTSRRRERRSWRGTHNSRPRHAGSILNRCNDRISNGTTVQRDEHCAATPKWWKWNNSATKNVIVALSATITPSRSATTTRSTSALR